MRSGAAPALLLFGPFVSELGADAEERALLEAAASSTRRPLVSYGASRTSTTNMHAER